MPTSNKILPFILHDEDIQGRTAESFPDPGIGGNAQWKTLISQPSTPTDTFTVGIATCEPGSGTGCPAGRLKLHRHEHAEIYHILAGKGVVTIDGIEHEVAKGSVVFIPGNAEHGTRCAGNEELRWLYVFAADGFGDIVYRFSGDAEKGGKMERKIAAKL